MKKVFFMSLFVLFLCSTPTLAQKTHPLSNFGLSNARCDVLRVENREDYPPHERILSFWTSTVEFPVYFSHKDGDYPERADGSVLIENWINFPMGCPIHERSGYRSLGFVKRGYTIKASDPIVHKGKHHYKIGPTNITFVIIDSICDHPNKSVNTNIALASQKYNTKEGNIRIIQALKNWLVKNNIEVWDRITTEYFYEDNEITILFDLEIPLETMNPLQPIIPKRITLGEVAVVREQKYVKELVFDPRKYPEKDPYPAEVVLESEEEVIAIDPIDTIGCMAFYIHGSWSEAETFEKLHEKTVFYLNYPHDNNFMYATFSDTRTNTFITYNRREKQLYLYIQKKFIPVKFRAVIADR